MDGWMETREKDARGETGSVLQGSRTVTLAFFPPVSTNIPLPAVLSSLAGSSLYQRAQCRLR
jgi:hypothetical protein